VKALHSISEGLETASCLAILFPLAFPLVAIVDGGGCAYIAWGAIATFLATLLLVPLTFVLQLASDLCESIANRIARNQREREESTRALHAYLLNGGRA